MSSKIARQPSGLILAELASSAQRRRASKEMALLAASDGEAYGVTHGQ